MSHVTLPGRKLKGAWTHDPLVVGAQYHWRVLRILGSAPPVLSYFMVVAFRHGELSDDYTQASLSVFDSNDRRHGSYDCRRPVGAVYTTRRQRRIDGINSAADANDVIAARTHTRQPGWSIQLSLSHRRQCVAEETTASSLLSPSALPASR